MIGAPGPRELRAYSRHCCSGHGQHNAERRGGRGEGQLAIGPQRPNARLLLLASFCRWREASAYAHSFS